MTISRIVLISAVLATAHAQSPPDVKPGITLRATTTLVQVTVIAHDAKGRAVTDLKQEDFQIFDNGEPQKIARFAAETAETADQAPKPAAPKAFADDPIASTEQDHGYAVVLLDYLNSGAIPAMRARVEVERLLKGFDPEGKAALYALTDDGVTDLGDFGTDREALLAKIAKVIGRPSPCSDRPFVDPDNAVRDALNRCEEGVFFFLYQRDLKTVDMLERFADRLSFVPGRKALIWVTSASDVHDVSPLVSKFVPKSAMLSYPIPRMTKLEARIENAMRKLNNADVGLYTVDVCAISTPGDPCYSHTAVLEDFAKRTGGRAFIGTNDLAGAMRTAAEDVRTTYSLAFYASPDADLSKFHQIKVQVRRPGITLSYRQGYSLGTALTAASLVKEIPGAEARALRLKALAMTSSIFNELEGLAAITAAGNFDASMTVPYFYTTANVAVVDLAMEMAVDRLKFTEANGQRSAELNFATQAVRPDGAVAAKFTDTVKFSFGTEAEVTAFFRRPYRYERQFRLAAGNYDVRVAFGSGETSLGRASAPLEIDGWDGKTLAVSGIALSRETRKAAPGAAALEARKALISGDTEIVPAGSLRFKRGEPCKAYCEIYDPSRASVNAPKLSAQLRVLDPVTGQAKVDSGVIAVEGMAKPGDPIVPVLPSVPVDRLAAGKYKLEVKAMRAGAEPVTRVVDFEVE